MARGTVETGADDFSSLLDELFATAKIKDAVKRQFMMIRLSGASQDKYGIDPESYLELHKKYQEDVRHIVDIRALGGIVYKGLISASALAAAIGTLNTFSFVADQRGKSIASSWNTLKENRGEPIDGGRKSALENLIGFGEILYHIDLSNAPLIRLDARPSCSLLRIPSGTFGIFWRQRNLADKRSECMRAELQDAKFNGAWIYEANFSRANLREAKFNKGLSGEKVRAQGINLSHSDLTRAEFIDADLTPSKDNPSSLEGANLTDANLSGAKLTGAILKGVTLCRTKIRISGHQTSRTIGYEPLMSIRAKCRDRSGQIVKGEALLLN
jgi:hypothetical protein